jgi:hypothetical protein
MHGVHETNPLPSRDYHEHFHNAPTVYWSDKRLAKVTRLRLLSDPGYPYWDVSYCHGVMRDGTLVRVSLPFSQLPKRSCKATIIGAAKLDGVYALGLGVFDALSTLV